MKARSFPLDVLRSVGLFCVIFAHVNPPNVLFQLRNFDVPLMVIISGFLFGNNELGKQFNLLDYLKKRFLRLIVPVWVFLALYFLCYFVSCLFLHIRFPFSILTIGSTFALWSGIGYVWIIRVFFSVAVLGPLFVNKLMNKDNKFVLFLLFYVLYELTFFIFNLYIPLGGIKTLATGLLFNTMGYLLIFTLGVIFYKHQQLLNKMSFKPLIFCFVILFMAEILTYVKSGDIIDFQYYKYPPRTLYLFYSLLISLVAIKYHYLFNKISNTFFINIISFIGSSTLWIYLWHIPFIIYFNTIHISFFYEYCIVLLCCTLLTFLQQKLVDFLISKSHYFKNRERLLRIVFYG